jgi:hypothetical protein
MVELNKVEREKASLGGDFRIDRFEPLSKSEEHLSTVSKAIYSRLSSLDGIELLPGLILCSPAS